MRALLLLLLTVFIAYCESTRIRPVSKHYKVGLLRRFAPFRIRPALRRRYYGYGMQKMPYYSGYGGVRQYGGYRPSMSYGSLSRGYGQMYGGRRSFVRQPYNSKKSYGRQMMPRRRIIPLKFGKTCGKYEVLVCKKYTKNRCFKICGYKGCQVRCTCSCRRKPRKIVRPQILPRKQQLMPKRIVAPPKHVSEHINILPNKLSIPMCGKKSFLRCSAKKMSHLSNHDCSNACMIKTICQQGCICRCMSNNLIGQGIGVVGSGMSGLGGIGPGFVSGGLNGGPIDAALGPRFDVGRARLDHHLGRPVGIGGMGGGGLKEENVEVKIDVISGGNQDGGIGGIGSGVGISTGGLGVDPTLGVGIGGGDLGFGHHNSGLPIGILGMGESFGGGADLSFLGPEGTDLGFGQGLGTNLGAGIDAGSQGLGGIVQDLGLQDLGGLNTFGLGGNVGVGIDGGEGLGNDFGMAGLGLDFGFGTGNAGGGIDSNLGIGLGGHGMDLGHSNVGVGVNDLGGVNNGVGVGTGINGLDGPGLGLGSDLGIGVGGPGFDFGSNPGVGVGGSGFDFGSNPGVGVGGSGFDLGSNPGVGVGGSGFDFGSNPGVGVGGSGFDLGSNPGVGVGGSGFDFGSNPGVGVGGSGFDFGSNPGVGVGGSGFDIGSNPGVGVSDHGIGTNHGVGIQSGHGSKTGLGHNAGVGIDQGHGPDLGLGHNAGVGIDQGHGLDLGLGHNAGVGVAVGHGANSGFGRNPGVGIDHGHGSDHRRGHNSGVGVDQGHGKAGFGSGSGVAIAKDQSQGGGLDLSGIAPGLNLNLNGLGITSDANNHNQGGPADPLMFQDPTLPPGGSNAIAVADTGMNSFGLFPDTGSPGLGLDLNPSLDFGQQARNDPLNFPL